MKLINARPSPFGRKVSIALREKGIAFEVEWEEPWLPGTRVGDHNPLSQLPILIADNGETVFESSFILEWIERRYPDPPLLPADDDGFLRARQLMVVAEGVMDAAAAAAQEMMRADANAGWLTRQQAKIDRGIDALSAHVAGQEFAVDGRFSQADIAIGVNLTMLEFMRDKRGHAVEPRRWRERHPSLGRYVDRMEARPSFQATKPEPILGLSLS